MCTSQRMLATLRCVCVRDTLHLLQPAYVIVHSSIYPPPPSRNSNFLQEQCLDQTIFWHMNWSEDYQLCQSVYMNTVPICTLWTLCFLTQNRGRGPGDDPMAVFNLARRAFILFSAELSFIHLKKFKLYCLARKYFQTTTLFFSWVL